MKLAARLSGRVAKLVLLEPIPFDLLMQTGRMDIFAEAMNLHNVIKRCGANGDWATAAEKFADYWSGTGTWRAMSADRRLAFSEALKPNFFEWDAVMDDTTSVEEWAAALRWKRYWYSILRRGAPREIAAILRRSCPGWTFAEVPGAGHMAPITHPDLIDPLVCSFLQSVASNKDVRVEGWRSAQRIGATL